MDLFEVAKYLFMGIFVLFFAMDIFMEKSYKVHYYISITLAIIFVFLGKNWLVWVKASAIILVVLLMIKTLFNERKGRDKIED